MSPAIPKCWPSLYHRKAVGWAEGLLCAADQEFGGVGEGGFVDLTGEHPGELPAALHALDALYARDRPPLRFLFLDDDVRARLRGYLREVGDGKGLVAAAELPQLRADRRCRLPAYTGVDLVEDVGRTRLQALLGEPYGQHYPGELPARCVAPDGQFGLSGVGLDHELDPFCARRAWFCWDKLGAEGRLPEVEVREVLLHLTRQPLCGGLPARTQLGRYDFE